MAAKKKTLRKKPSTKRAAPAAKKSTKRPAAKSKAAPKKSSSAAKTKTTSAKKKSTRVVRKTKRPALRPKAKAKPKKSSVKLVLPTNDEGLKLAKLVASSAYEKKALDVVVLDVRSKGPEVGYDYVVVATGESDRQLEALADAARDAAKTVNRSATTVEAAPDWVLVNFDDVMVHFFTPDKRETYDIEGIWSFAPRIAVAG